MKKILVITVLLITTLSGSLMAKNGFGVNVTVPFGVSIGTYTGNGAKEVKSRSGFEFGIHVIPGYYFGFDTISFGIGLDLGYEKESFGFKDKASGSVGGFSFDTINLGLMPSIDVGFISVGIGGGVKFPITGLRYIDDPEAGIFGQVYNTKNIRDTFKNPFIPYVKVTLDFILPLNLTAGIYVSYDIPLMEVKSGQDQLYPGLKLSGVDLGAQLGIKF